MTRAPAKRRLHAPARRQPALRPAAIDKARDDALARIAAARGRGQAADALLDKAQRLLTQRWSKASWAARATLLKSADWLIRVAARPGAAPPDAL